MFDFLSPPSQTLSCILMSDCMSSQFDSCFERRSHLGHDHILSVNASPLQGSYVVLQVPHGQLSRLEVALDFLQLLLLLLPELLQHHALLIVQDLMESSEFTADACLQICPDSLQQIRVTGARCGGQNAPVSCFPHINMAFMAAKWLDTLKLSKT